MEFTTRRENFLTALQTATRFISSKPQLPILNSFLLEITKENIATLSATDLQLGIKITFAVTTAQPGEIVIPAKLLTEVIAASSAGEIICSLAGSRFSVKTNTTKAHFQTTPAEEYPVFPKQEGEVVQLPKLFFSEIDKQIVFATSKDETRPVLTGVYLQINEVLEAAATDGYRLALFRQPFVTSKNSTILFPARAIQEISRLLEKVTSANVDFYFSSDLKQAFFRFDNSEMVVRTLDGNFPTYNKIIPRDFQTTVLMDKQELEHQVKTALLFSRDISSVLKMTLENTSCTITAGAGTTGEYEAQVEISEKVPEKKQIAFNGKFVLDILQRIRTKEISFQMNDEMKPGVFSEVGNDQLLYVVMPFRLNS